MDAEKLMDAIIEEVYMLAGELAASVKAEEYEKSALLRDGIEAKLELAADKLVDNGLTTLTKEQLVFYLTELSHGFLVDWFQVMEMEPPERNINNI